MPVFKQTRSFTQLCEDSRHELFLNPSSDKIVCAWIHCLFFILASGWKCLEKMKSKRVLSIIKKGGTLVLFCYFICRGWVVNIGIFERSSYVPSKKYEKCFIDCKFKDGIFAGHTKPHLLNFLTIHESVVKMHTCYTKSGISLLHFLYL